jgi:hypothetical protein
MKRREEKKFCDRNYFFSHCSIRKLEREKERKREREYDKKDNNDNDDDEKIRTSAMQFITEHRL